MLFLVTCSLQLTCVGMLKGGGVHYFSLVVKDIRVYNVTCLESRRDSSMETLRIDRCIRSNNSSIVILTVNLHGCNKRFIE
jgi:hypothetical protein